MLTSEIDVAGPYYDELEVGQVYDSSPGLTLTDGHAALHQAILGDRLRLALDADLAAQVTGTDRHSLTPASSATSRSASRRWPRSG